MSVILKNLATLGFIGYLPVAPGTFGAMAAAAFFLLLKPSSNVHLSLLLVIAVSGALASGRAERIFDEKDSRRIVIDEFAGYGASVLFVPFTLSFTLAAFLLFRFFDILKPPPIRWMEKALPGGTGVMADDLVAGIYANLLLQVWMLLR